MSRRQRRVGAAGASAVVAMLLWATVGAGVASAHAFLVGSDPAQGSRLAQPPATITLVFSEQVVASATTVTVRLAGGQPVTDVVERAPSTSTVRVRLTGERPDGIYVVSWQNLSAEDGHAALGEFAFAAGAGASAGAGGALPSAAQAGVTPDWLRVAATALYLVGLSLAAGGAVTGLVVDRSVSTRSRGVRAGLVAATVGAVGAFATEVGSQGGLSHAALLSGLAALFAAGALGAAALIRQLPPVLATLVASGILWAADGHPALVGGALGLAVNAVHVVVGTVWAGTLGYLLVGMVRHRRQPERMWDATGRYSQLALPLVVVLALAGGASAWEALPSWSSLYSSGYGQLILVKVGVFAGALGFAWWSRYRGLRSRAAASVLSRTVPVEAVLVTVVLLVSAVLASTGPPARTQPGAAVLGPPPLSGPVERAAGLAGELNVSVAAGGGQLQVQVTVPEGPTRAARVELDAFYPDGRDVGVFPRSCGPGCFSQSFSFPNGISSLHVTAAARGWSGGTFVASIGSPPPVYDPALLQRLVATMDAVPHVSGSEAVTSNSARRPFTTAIPAMSGRSLMALQPYAGGGPEQPAASAGITDVQPLLAGGPGLQLYLPGTPLWATLWLDSQGRLVRQRLVDPGHVITDTFTYPS